MNYVPTRYNVEHVPALAGTLTAYDFPGTSVSLYLGDLEVVIEGYTTFNNAFWCEEEEWTVVYTEHLGYFVFRTSDVINLDGQEFPNTRDSA